jgi:hypothetical protein
MFSGEIPNSFTGSAEIVLIRKRVAGTHEKHHAYCNIIISVDRRSGTRGSGGGGGRGGRAYRSAACLSLVPVWGPNWEGGRCHDDFYRDGEPHDQWHWRGGGDRDHWQGGPGDRDWQGGGGDRDHWQGGGGERDHWQGGHR